MNVTEKRRKRALIAGAGPAGLTAAYELARQKGWDVTVAEASDHIGGISRTVSHHSNRMDIGGHRFFSKSRRVTDFWEKVMPSEGNPDREDRVMLRRPRVSRIFYLRRFFDYPISMSRRTFANMGLGRTLRAGFGFIMARLHRLPETSLENFYKNRFGAPLYRMFFEDYTRKVWGVHPRDLGADWGSQRVKGLSLSGILKDMVLKAMGRKSAKVETSLIEEFSYPKYGPGQLWEAVAADAARMGARVMMEREVKEVHVEGGRVAAVTMRHPDGSDSREECDVLMSSMPLSELVASLRGVEVPDDVRRIAAGLPYRDFITVGLLLDGLEIENDTSRPTYLNRIPDTWIYIQERDVRIGRLQVFNNWSPYMVADEKGTVWLGLEYFCSEGDELWEMSDADFIEMAKEELEKIGIIRRDRVRDAVRIKMKKAYPSYFGTYHELGRVREWLDTIPNLYCIGRNGQHRYNNMDHSMLTAMEAVDALTRGDGNKERVWGVNTEEDYHEEEKEG